MLENVSSPVLNNVNNLRVVVQEKNSKLTTLGVTVDSGPVYENDSISGISKFIADLALDGPSSRGNGSLRDELRQIGAILGVDYDRESTSFTVRCFPEDVDRVIGILGDIIKNRDYSQVRILSCPHFFRNLLKG